jgi:hypothetical protein
MFQISNNGLPASMSGPDRRRAAQERASAWLARGTDDFAETAGDSINRLGVMASDQMAASQRNTEQAMARHAEKKAAEANKGGGIFGQILGGAGKIAGLIPGGQAIGIGLNAASRFF